MLRLLVWTLLRAGRLLRLLRFVARPPLLLRSIVLWSLWLLATGYFVWLIVES